MAATVNGMHVDDLVATVRQEITEIYRVYNPGKRSEVPAFMQKYAGREVEMMQKIQAKYDVPNAGTSGLSVLRRGIEKMLSKHNPERLGEVGQLVVRHTEQGLFDKLRAKYEQSKMVKPVVIDIPPSFATDGVMASDEPDAANLFMMQMKRFDGSSVGWARGSEPLSPACPRFEAELVSDCSGDIAEEEVRLSKMTPEQRGIHSEQLLKLWRTDDEEADIATISQAAVVHTPAHVCIGLGPADYAFGQASGCAFATPPGRGPDSCGYSAAGTAGCSSAGRGELLSVGKAVAGDVIGCTAVFDASGGFTGVVRMDRNGEHQAELLVGDPGRRRELEGLKAAAAAAENYEEAGRLKRLLAAEASLFPVFVLGRGDRIIVRRKPVGGGRSPAVSPVADSLGPDENWLGAEEDGLGPAALEFGGETVDYACEGASSGGREPTEIALCFDQLEWLQTMAAQREETTSDVLGTLVVYCNSEDAARKKVIFRNPRCRRCTAATQGGKKAASVLGLDPAHVAWLGRTAERCNHPTVGKTVRILLDWYKLYAGNECWEREGEDGVAAATSFGGITTLNVQSGPGKR